VVEQPVEQQDPRPRVLIAQPSHPSRRGQWYAPCAPSSSVLSHPHQLHPRRVQEVWWPRGARESVTSSEEAPALGQAFYPHGESASESANASASESAMRSAAPGQGHTVGQVQTFYSFLIYDFKKEKGTTPLGIIQRCEGRPCKLPRRPRASAPQSAPSGAPSSSPSCLSSLVVDWLSRGPRIRQTATPRTPRHTTLHDTAIVATQDEHKVAAARALSGSENMQTLSAHTWARLCITT
jgi:hypothetical protein